MTTMTEAMTDRGTVRLSIPATVFVVLLTWMYLTCLLLLLGGKLNAILRREGEKMRPAAPAAPEAAAVS